MLKKHLFQHSSGFLRMERSKTDVKKTTDVQKTPSPKSPSPKKESFPPKKSTKKTNVHTKKKQNVLHNKNKMSPSQNVAKKSPKNAPSKKLSAPHPKQMLPFSRTNALCPLPPQKLLPPSSLPSHSPPLLPPQKKMPPPSAQEKFSPPKSPLPKKMPPHLPSLPKKRVPLPKKKKPFTQKLINKCPLSKKCPSPLLFLLPSQKHVNPKHVHPKNVPSSPRKGKNAPHQKKTTKKKNAPKKTKCPLHKQTNINVPSPKKCPPLRKCHLLLSLLSHPSKKKKTFLPSLPPPPLLQKKPSPLLLPKQPPLPLLLPNRSPLPKKCPLSPPPEKSLPTKSPHLTWTRSRTRFSSTCEWCLSRLQLEDWWWADMIEGNVRTAWRKGRTTLLHSRGSISIPVSIWLVNNALDSVGRRVWTAQTTITQLAYLTLRGIQWIHVWWQLMDLECFSCFEQVSAFSSLVGGLRYVLTREQMTDFLCFSVSSSVVHPAVFFVISWYMCTHVGDTSLHQALDRSRRRHTLQFTYTSHRS